MKHDPGVASAALPMELLEMLRCPETGQKLAPAPPELLERLSKSTLRNRDGAAVSQPLEAAFIREDGAALYPMRDGIPMLLLEEAIVLPPST